MTTAGLQPLLLDTRDAAKLLACSAGHVRNLIQRGELTPIRVGKLLRFSVADLQAFIAKQRQAAGAAQ